MRTEDRKEFLEVVVGFAELRGKELSAPALELYWNAMQEWPLEDFKAAANHLMRTMRFMPTPADFHELRKSSAMTAGEAFEKARQIVRSKWQGELISYQSGDVRLDTAIRACGGFEALAMCTTENVGYFERRFAEHYESISDADETRLALPSIASRLNGPTRISDIGKSLTPPGGDDEGR